MPYAYYQKLNAKQKVIYRRSDSITTIPLTNSKSLLTTLEQLKMALIAEERRETESILKILAKGILTNLKVAPINIKLLAARPSHDWGELHGLYEVSEGKFGRTCNKATKIPYSTTLFKSLFYAFQGNNNDDNNDHLKHSAVAELL